MWEWTNNKVHVFYHQRKGSQEEFGRGKWHYSCQCGTFMALTELRLVLDRNFLPKCFFLRGRSPISFKKDGVLCQRLSSSYSECIECEDMCVFVYPSLLLLPSTWTVNLTFKCCMLLHAQVFLFACCRSDIDNSLQHLLDDQPTEWQLHCLRLNKDNCPSSFASSEIPLLYQMEKKLWNCKICYGT